MGIRAVASQAATVTIVTCTVVLTILVLRREFFTPVPPQTAQPVEVTDWSQVVSRGHRLGPDDARVTLVEFGDFQCPYCASFALEVLPTIFEEFGEEVAVVFRHWPLPSHDEAYNAAKAAECAAFQGRFREMHDALFSGQAALGTKLYRAYAEEAGVADLEAFNLCYSAPAPVSAIEEDIAEARRIRARGTPTIVVNGLMLPGGGNPTRVREAILKELEGGL